MSTSTHSLPASLPRGLEGLRALARACRNPLPANFEWNFWHFRQVRRSAEGTPICGCALGLGSIIWPDEFADYLEDSNTSRTHGSITYKRVAEYFEISDCNAKGLFLFPGLTPLNSPIEMAERLDEFLAARGFPTSLEP